METLHDNPYHILHDRQEALEDLLERGVYHPILLHYILLLVLPPFLVTLLCRRSNPYSLMLRLLTFAWTAGLGYWIAKNCRTTQLQNGFGVGLIIGNLVVRFASMLLFQNPEVGFYRLERRISHNMSSASLGQHDTLAASDIYIWQSYPEPLRHRIAWLLCLLFNFSGPSWNWSCKGDPRKSLPGSLVEAFAKQPTKQVEAQAVLKAPSNLLAAVVSLAKLSLKLALVSLLRRGDLYYFGKINPDLPFPGTSTSIPASSIFAMFWRTLISISWIQLVLTSMFIRGHIYAILMSALFPGGFAYLFRITDIQTWMYSDPFGPFSALCSGGINDVWAVYWHQVYRFDIHCASQWALSFIARPLQRARAIRSLVRVTAGFTISAFVHMLGSYTQFAETKPVAGVGLFFLLQWAGIIVQTVLVGLIRQWLPRLSVTSLSSVLARAFSLALVVAWMTVTGPIIFDEYAKGLALISDTTPWCLMRRAGIALPFFQDCDTRRSDIVQFWKGNTWWTTGIRIF